MVAARTRTTVPVDVIVIGSGFGGSVTACRLAESGRRVLVLERGPHRTGDQFPRLGQGGLSPWLWTSEWNGLFDVRMFRQVASVTASGVGGGSHIYANVHLRAPEASFREGWPAGLGAETLTPYYGRVERMLGVAPLPERVELPKSRAYAAAAARTGAPVFRPNLAVHYGEGRAAAAVADPPRPVRDPYGLGVDILQEPCRHCGQCNIGCPYNAKNSLDLNYLAVAQQRHGAVVQPLAEVVAIVPEREGYRVYYHDRERFGRDSVWAPQVVIAAGTIGTVELLLRCRDEFGVLPELSAALGTHFSGNGDFLCAAFNTRDQIEAWRGPTITTAARYLDDQFHFYLQEGGYTPELAFFTASFRPDADFLAKFLRGPIGHAARLRAFYKEIGRLAQNHQALAEQLPGDALVFLGMGQDASNGRILLKKRLGRRPKLTIDWDHTRSKPLFERMEAEFRHIAEELGGEYVASPLYTLLGRLITVHPLGGAALADDAARGVTNPMGEVWGYPNLFVADGAVIPRSLGPNPSLTISAVAERIAERIVAD